MAPCSDASTTISEIDEKDALTLDLAFRDERLSYTSRQIIRLFYVKQKPPRAIERITYLAPRTFRTQLEVAVKKFQSIVDFYGSHVESEKNL